MRLIIVVRLQVFGPIVYQKKIRSIFEQEKIGSNIVRSLPARPINHSGKADGTWGALVAHAHAFPLIFSHKVQIL